MTEKATQRSYGLSADQDNREFAAVYLARFEALYQAPITWRRPEGNERAKYVALARHLGRNVLAVGQYEQDHCLVLDCDWSGFPDPAEFLFLADPDITSFFLTAKKPKPTGFQAVGFFEDWPTANWGPDPARVATTEITD